MPHNGHAKSMLKVDLEVLFLENAKRDPEL